MTDAIDDDKGSTVEVSLFASLFILPLTYRFERRERN